MKLMFYNCITRNFGKVRKPSEGGRDMEDKKTMELKQEIIRLLDKLSERELSLVLAFMKAIL